VNLPDTALAEGTNTLRITLVADTGWTTDRVYLNWFEIDYNDGYVAESDLLAFDGDAAGSWNFRVSGFTTGAVEVFDITNPASPQRVVNGVTAAGQLRFDQTIAGPRRYIALTSDRLTSDRRIKPASIALDQPSNLRDTSNQASYIIISHVAFLSPVSPNPVSPMQQLANFRATQGFTTAVVDVQDVYDEFSGGVFDPNAIHDFLDYAYHNWTQPRPMYVVLGGDGHFDYKNIYPWETNFIPPFLSMWIFSSESLRPTIAM